MLSFPLKSLARPFGLLAACLVILPATAQTPQPVGPGVQVHTFEPGLVGGPRVAWRCDADVTLVAWSSTASPGSDQDSNSVQARFFSGQTPTGPQFQVNQYTAGSQSGPLLQVLDNGDFAVAWFSRLETGQPLSLRLRTFDRVTLAPSPEREVISDLPTGDRSIQVRLTEDGRFALARLETPEVVGQIYDLTTGQPLGPEMRVEVMPETQGAGIGTITPGITFDGDDVILLWHAEQHVEPGTDDYEIWSLLRFQRFSSDGTPTGPEVLVDSHVQGCDLSCGSSLIGPARSQFNREGEFVVSYLEYYSSYIGGTEWLWVKRFAEDGAENLSLRMLGGNLRNDDLEVEDDGDFLVVWNGLGGLIDADQAEPEPVTFSTIDQPGSNIHIDVAYNDPGSAFTVAWSTNSQKIWWRRFKSFPDILQDGFESGDTSRWCVARSAE